MMIIKNGKREDLIKKVGWMIDWINYHGVPDKMFVKMFGMQVHLSSLQTKGKLHEICF
jgi:hypothetical protein